MSMRTDDVGDTRAHDEENENVRRSDLSMHIDLGEPTMWIPHNSTASPSPRIMMSPPTMTSEEDELPVLVEAESFLDTDSFVGDTNRYGAIERSAPLPFRQDALWSSLALCFFGLLLLALLLFTISPKFQHFVVRNANALFTIPYVISFVVILACLAPWVPSHAGSLTQMNVGVIASVSDYLLILLVLLEWAVCLALMLVTLVAVHDGLSYISVDGVIVPRDSDTTNNGTTPPVPDTAVGGIPHNSPLILLVPVLTLYALFNVLLHTYSCIEALIRRRRRLSDTDIAE